jgi:carboxymethylenebutenolidase
MSERVEIETPAGAMPAHLWLPDEGTGPGVVLVQEIFGVTPYIERRAQDLADLGYVVLVPEIFWRLGVSKVDDGPSALEEGMGLLQRLDWAAAVADGVSAVTALRERPEVRGGTGVLGFCFGGGLGFNVVAEVEVDAFVSYYGSGLPQLLGLQPDQPGGVPVVDPAAVTAPSLHHFGLSDAFIPRPVVEQIEAALTTDPRVTFVTYETGDHAFDNADFASYDEEVSRLAWARTEDWLAENLPTDRA